MTNETISAVGLPGEGRPTQRNTPAEDLTPRSAQPPTGEGSSPPLVQRVPPEISLPGVGRDRQHDTVPTVPEVTRAPEITRLTEVVPQQEVVRAAINSLKEGIVAYNGQELSGIGGTVFDTDHYVQACREWADFLAGTENTQKINTQTAGGGSREVDALNIATATANALNTDYRGQRLAATEMSGINLPSGGPVSAMDLWRHFSGADHQGWKDVRENDSDLLILQEKSRGNPNNAETRAAKIILADREMFLEIQQFQSILESPAAYYQWRARGCIMQSKIIEASSEKTEQTRSQSGASLRDDEVITYYRRHRLDDLRSEIEQGNFRERNAEIALVLDRENSLSAWAEQIIVNFHGFSQAVKAIRRFGINNDDTLDKLRTYFTDSHIVRGTERGQQLRVYIGDIQDGEADYRELGSNTLILPDADLALSTNNIMTEADRAVIDFCGHSFIEQCREEVQAERPGLAEELQKRQERGALSNIERSIFMREYYWRQAQRALRCGLNTYLDRNFWPQGGLPSREGDHWATEIENVQTGIGELIWIAGGKVYLEYIRACHRVASFYHGEFADFVSSDVKGKVSGWVCTNYPPDSHMAMVMSDHVTAKAMQILDCQAQLRVRCIMNRANEAGVEEVTRKATRIRYEHKARLLRSGNTEEVLTARLDLLAQELNDLLVQECGHDDVILESKKEWAYLRASEVRDLTGDSVLYLLGDEDTHKDYGVWCQNLPLKYRYDLGSGSWFFYLTQLWRGINMKAMVMEVAQWNTPAVRQLAEAAYYDTRYYTYLRTSVMKASLSKGKKLLDGEEQRVIDYLERLLPDAVSLNSKTKQKELEVARLDMSVVNTADLYAEVREKGIDAFLRDRTTAQAMENYLKNIGLAIESFNVLNAVLEADMSGDIQALDHAVKELQKKAANWENLTFRTQYTAAVEAYRARRYAARWLMAGYDRNLGMETQKRINASQAIVGDLYGGVAESIHNVLYLGRHIQGGARRENKGHIYKFNVLWQSPKDAFDWQEAARESIFLLGGGTRYLEDNERVVERTGIEQLQHFCYRHIRNSGVADVRGTIMQGYAPFEVEHLVAFAGLKMERVGPDNYFFRRAEPAEMDARGCTLPDKVGLMDEGALNTGELRLKSVDLSDAQYAAIEAWLRIQLGGSQRQGVTADNLRSVPALDNIIVRPMYYDMAGLNTAVGFEEVVRALNRAHGMRLGLKPGILFRLDDKEKGVLVVQNEMTGEPITVMDIDGSLSLASLDPYWAAASADGFNIREDAAGAYIIPPPVLHPKDRKIGVLEHIIFNSEWWLTRTREMQGADVSYLADAVVWRKILHQVHSHGKLNEEYPWLCERLPFLNNDIRGISKAKDIFQRIVRTQLDIAYEGALPSEIGGQAKPDRVMEALKSIWLAGGLIFKPIDTFIPGRVMPKNLTEGLMKATYTLPILFTLARIMGGLGFAFKQLTVTSTSTIEGLKILLQKSSFLVDGAVNFIQSIPLPYFEAGPISWVASVGLFLAGLTVWKLVNDNTSINMEERKRIDKWGTISILGLDNIPFPPNICAWLRLMARRRGIHDYYGPPIKDRVNHIEEEIKFYEGLDNPEQKQG